MKKLIVFLTISVLIVSCSTNDESADNIEMDNATAILGMWNMTFKGTEGSLIEIPTCENDPNKRADYIFFGSDGTFENNGGCDRSGGFSSQYAVTGDFVTIDGQLVEIRKLTNQELILVFPSSNDFMEIYER